ncbi:hypothetical protein PsYK624_097090 [Phanerochaete sordida]|uniref:Uncharacterized protein n=1 Tax=Phanerochaete sordida TaxID=48140 RepID=A0A9P3LFR3_9APHY|nr:hypothetical protein PsYK624_097090 [Phanerochaete sordida]
MHTIKAILGALSIGVLLLCVFVPGHNALTISVTTQDAYVVEASSRPFWKKPWDWASHKASDIYYKIEDSAAQAMPLPSWENIESYASGLLMAMDNDLNDAVSKLPIKDSVQSFRTTFHELQYSASDMKVHFEYLTTNGLTWEDISNDIAEALQAVLKELKEAFPPPDHAPSHEHRQVVTRTTLEKVETAILDVARKHGMPADRVEALRISFDNAKPVIEKAVVITGDLIEQHPILFETLLFAGTAMLIPESWLLRPVLSMFGFGPYGPVKGTSAAWAQRTFYGAAVTKNSWFSALQRAGMKGTVPRKIIGGIGAGIGAGVGVLC